MKVMSCEVHNFASYKHLKFDFSNQGLCLISGPTGSGKSTLCDIIPWCLFGVTAKNGSVDEIRSWDSDEATVGHISLLLANGEALTITRTRGKANDLYFNLEERGKDLVDTQKLINNLLNCNADTYLSGAYYHEFSKAAQFFTTTAKTRRQITEQIVDLSLAKSLTENLSLYKKELKDELATIRNSIGINLKQIKYVKQQIDTSDADVEQWNEQQTAKITKTQSLYRDFESTKQDELEALELEHEVYKLELESQINELTSKLKPDSYYVKAIKDLEDKIAEFDKSVCEHCGAPKDNTNKMLHTKNLYSLKSEQTKNQQQSISLVSMQKSLETSNKHHTYRAVEAKRKETNTYGSQLESLKAQENPYIKIKENAQKDSKAFDNDLKSLKLTEGDLVRDLDDIELLLTVIETFRGEIVKNAVVRLEESTNDLLSKHFDAEIRVSFDITEADKLEVMIYKDSHQCVYTQLSKGQRQLLKLCFGISIMEAISNHQGIDFNVIMIDEALDGLSEEFKIKSYGLLSALSTKHDTVLVVEHSNELKNMFTKKIEVTLTGDGSTLDYI